MVKDAELGRKVVEEPTALLELIDQMSVALLLAHGRLRFLPRMAHFRGISQLNIVITKMRCCAPRVESAQVVDLHQLDAMNRYGTGGAIREIESNEPFKKEMEK